MQFVNCGGVFDVKAGIRASLDSMKVRCPSCRKLLAVNDQLAGKTVKCPCGTKMKISTPPEAQGLSPTKGGRSKTPIIQSSSSAPPPMRPQNSSLDDGLFDELTQNDFANVATTAGGDVGASAGMKNIAMAEIHGAVGHITETRRDSRKETGRRKFLFISIVVFLSCFIPTVAILLYKASRNSSGFYAAWAKQNSEASLATGSTGGTKVVGAEAQKPIKVTNQKHLYQPGGLEKFSSELRVRVQELIDEVMAKELEAYKERGQKIPENGFLDWVIGWPERVKIERLDVTITKNDFILCELVVTGQPLMYALEADFYITSVEGYKWKKATDNAPFGKPSNNLFRDTIIKDLVRKMQR